MQSTQSFDGFDHLGHDLTGSVGPYSAPTGYTQVGSIGYDNPPHMYTGPAEQRGDLSQCQLDGHRTPRHTQCIQIAPGPPLLEQYAPVVSEMPNDGPPGHVLPPNVASSRGNHSPLQPGMPGRDDLKNLASHYLHDISSYVDKVRMRQSRSGTVKVLILLEIEEQYAPVIPEMLNNRGSSRHGGDSSLKNLASYYVNNPGSHVNKLRLRRSRSGAIKVLILLEIN